MINAKMFICVFFAVLTFGCTSTVPIKQNDTGHQQPQDSKGIIRGTLCYPSSYIPAMTLYVRNIETGETHSLDLKESTENYGYEIEVPTGSYVVFVWSTLAGGAYSQAVPCGLRADCNDHSLIPVVVESEKVVEGIDPCDFYSEKDVPMP